MRSTFRTLYLGLLTLCGLTAMAQNSVTVMGTVSPCNGASYPVRIQSAPFTLPTVDTIVNTDANCSYSFTFQPTTSNGLMLVQTSCDGGQTFGESDTASYSIPIDTLMVNLSCGGGPENCQAAFSMQQAVAIDSTLIPWQMTTTNLSTGAAPIISLWSMPDGSTSTAFDPTFTFTQAGVYGICLTISAGTCSSVVCDTVVVDSAGYISTQPVWFDCFGVMWGTNLPGTPCDDGNPTTTGTTWSTACECVDQGGGTMDCLGILNGPNVPGTACTDTTFIGIITGTWSANCVCQADSGTTDCLGIPGGPNLPGTLCIDSLGGLVIYGNWDANCVCVPGTFFDCLGVAGGTNLPGTACTDSTGNPGTWDANCYCIPDTSSTTCNADFWVIQAYDSTAAGGVEPIPNEVWVWNLSSGGNGTYQFLWNFGDGSSSTDAYPTHVYNSNGPWNLCLTIASGNCTDMYCDSVSVDANGILNQLVIGGDHGTVGHTSGSGARSEGFTLNVIQQVPTNITEIPAFAELKAWPNPVMNELNLTLNSRESGSVPVTVIDPTGRTVISGTQRLSAGNNTFMISTTNLEPGLYMVRIGNDARSITQRFMKVR